MKFINFLKKIALDAKNGMLKSRSEQRNLSPAILMKIDSKIAVTNMRRLIPFSAIILFIEILNQITIYVTNPAPAVHTAYLLAGFGMILLTAATIWTVYRTLDVDAVDISRCRLIYRIFWGGFSLLMLVFVILEIETRGLTNNFFYLLILTAAFPLLSWKEALCLFCFDFCVTFPITGFYGFTPQQQLQLPLITFFSLALSRMLYQSQQSNDIMLERVELSNRKLETLAQTDPLTGLLNRRGIKEQLQEILLRMGRPCSVAFLMIDIDLFKSYNDRYGHEQGDQCIIKISGVLEQCVRSQTDLAARIGGEEFLLVLIDCEVENALKCAHRLHQEVLELALQAADVSVSSNVTVSIGAAVEASPIDFTSLYGQADKALYIAKNAGRNCVAMDNVVCYSDMGDTIKEKLEEA